MKKYINLSFIYTIAAIICGVFYREFTKFAGFSGKTTLAFMHLHLFALGMIVFLLVALFAAVTNLEDQKNFRLFVILYNIALPFMTAMFLIRGILQVQGTELSNGANAAISGLSGVAHIIFTIAIVLLFLCLKKATVNGKNKR